MAVDNITLIEETSREIIGHLMIRGTTRLARGSLSALRAASSSPQGAIDVHTHMYYPGYMDILRKRTTIPKVKTINGEDRLIILPGEDHETTTSVGRPIGKEYWSVQSKLRFMDNHGIGKSVVSLANPWLDFLEGNEAEAVAQQLNDELQDICEQSCGRIFGFATLPVRNGPACVREIRRLRHLKHIRGVILGTPGAGKGLDDPEMFEILAEIESNNFMIFLHPHYGVGNEHYHNSGHALFLALGFPLETTVAVSRLIVSGVVDQFPNLKLLISHAGAALPSLIGRLDSCVLHDAAVCNRLKHAPSDYLKRFYFDAISYGSPSLQCLIDIVGQDRIMFGTDNPFFAPLSVPPGELADSDAKWPSATKVLDVVAGLGHDASKKILTDNAVRILNL